MDSSTGEILKLDTSKIIIPIKYIREANAKLIKYNYLLQISAEQDSIIKLNKLYIAEQDNIIKDFQGRVIILTNDNNNLKSTINKQHKVNTILTGVTGGFLAFAIGVLLIK